MTWRPDVEPNDEAVSRSYNNESRKGTHISIEHAEKVSKALKGRRPKNLESLWEKSRGRPWTEEQRKATMAGRAAKKLRGKNGLVC